MTTKDEEFAILLGWRYTPADDQSIHHKGWQSPNLFKAPSLTPKITREDILNYLPRLSPGERHEFAFYLYGELIWWTRYKPHQIGHAQPLYHSVDIVEFMAADLFKLTRALKVTLGFPVEYKFS